MYLLDGERNYRYLRIPDDASQSLEIRNNPKYNVKKFVAISEHLCVFDFTNDHKELLNKTLSAILNLGEVRFNENEEGMAEVENPESCAKVAELLGIDEKKFIWALTNYCFIDQGTAVRLRNTSNQARDARDMLANCLYARLVDWIVHIINNKMAKSRAI